MSEWELQDFGLQELGLDSAGCLSTWRMLSNKQLHDLKNI